MTTCWFGDDDAVEEYWFEPQHEWRPLCIGHAVVVADNLPEHYLRALNNTDSPVPWGPDHPDYDEMGQ